MALFSRNNQSVETGVEPQVEYQRNEGRRWPTLLVYTLAALLVSAGVVLLGRWVYDKASNSSNDSEKVVTQTERQNSLSDEQQKARNNSSSNPNPTTPIPNSPQNRNSAPSPQSGALPSSGPEDVIPIFITSSLAATGLHFIYTLRRQQKPLKQV